MQRRKFYKPGQQDARVLQPLSCRDLRHTDLRGPTTQQRTNNTTVGGAICEPKCEPDTYSVGNTQRDTECSAECKANSSADPYTNAT